MSTKGRVLYLQTEDWAFLSHRLPMSRAARDAGFDVHVAARVGQRRREIEAEGFTLHHIDWRRGSLSPVNLAKTTAQVHRLLHNVSPDILHNVAVKPVLVGSFASQGMKHMIVNNIVGLGAIFLSDKLHMRLVASGVAQVFRLFMNQRRTQTIVQNRDDQAFLTNLGVQADKII